MRRRIRRGLLAASLSLSFSAAWAAQPQRLPPPPTMGLPSERYQGALEQVASFRDAMPTGVTVSADGRIFVNYPRWGDEVPFTVAELKNGRAVAYPDAAINRADPKRPGEGFISVQSVVADGQGHLWVLDTAAPKFAAPIPGGAKLVEIDLASNKVIRRLVFPAAVMRAQTYVNDVRFDFRQGKAGVAYVTDSSLSGVGGIIVMDLATGQAWRRLTGDRSTSAEAGFTPVVEGQTMAIRHRDGSSEPFAVASDGIALSPDGKTLYYSPIASRHLYAIDTALLLDRSISEQALSAAVRDLGEKGMSDGLAVDANGVIYGGDIERDAIRMLKPGGKWETLAHDPRILWPDTLAIGTDGYLYFTVNQLHRQATFHAGDDQRQKPYSLLRIKIGAPAAPTR